MHILCVANVIIPLSMILFATYMNNMATAMAGAEIRFPELSYFRIVIFITNATCILL